MARTVRENMVISDLYQMVDLLRKNFSIVQIDDGEDFRFYVVTDFKPYNPSNHFHSTEIQGKNITKLLIDNPVCNSPHVIELINQKIEELPTENVIFSYQFKYIWFKIII